jgi:hypothetical protein
MYMSDFVTLSIVFKPNCTTRFKTPDTTVSTTQETAATPGGEAPENGLRLTTISEIAAQELQNQMHRPSSANLPMANTQANTGPIPCQLETNDIDKYGQPSARLLAHRRRGTPAAGFFEGSPRGIR